MGKEGAKQILTIPDHKELGLGILKGLIKTARISEEEFVRELRKKPR